MMTSDVCGASMGQGQGGWVCLCVCVKTKRNSLGGRRGLHCEGGDGGERGAAAVSQN